MNTGRRFQKVNYVVLMWKAKKTKALVQITRIKIIFKTYAFPKPCKTGGKRKTPTKHPSFITQSKTQKLACRLTPYYCWTLRFRCLWRGAIVITLPGNFIVPLFNIVIVRILSVQCNKYKG